MVKERVEDPDSVSLKELMVANHQVIMERFSAIEIQVDQSLAESRSVDKKLDRHMNSEESDIRQLKSVLDEHMRVLTTKIIEVENKALSGYPNNDPITHCVYHEDVIDNKKVWKNRWDKVITAVLEKGTIGFLTVVVIALWYYFLYKAGVPTK